MISANHARNLVYRWLSSRCTVPLIPILLLAAFWIGGETVLFAATALLAGAYWVYAPGPSLNENALVRDTVTNLPLRGALVEALDNVFSSTSRPGRATAAFAIQIDNLEELEQGLGLHLSEQVRRRVGERIAFALRGTDLVACIEGPVFGAVLGPAHRIDLESAIQTSARIQDAVRAPMLIDGTRVHVTVSVGFCLTRRSPRPTGVATVAAALDALDEARQGGPGSIRAFRRGRSRPAKTATCDSDIVDALEKGQVRPWFQPQVSTETGAVTGFEALVRWEHPERGILGPRQFLSALAENGQIERLGEVVLFHALTALRSWDRAGLQVPSVGVNYSGEELRNPRLADKLAWELDRFDLTPDRLTVEVLETVVSDGADDTITRNIAALAKLGCRIDLDDFGTGHASLAALRRFSVTRIKIDRSFVINVDEDPAQRKMIAGILGLAEKLGLETLAEGVERVAEHATLAQLGCHHVQGFGIGRPMPFEDTIGWMKRYRDKLTEPPEVPRRTG